MSCIGLKVGLQLFITLKENSLTFHGDVQSVLMVTVVNCSNKFLSLCLLTEKAEFSEFVLLTQLFLLCLHVPGCIAWELSSGGNGHFIVENTVIASESGS